jgi:hypothetical protein
MKRSFVNPVFIDSGAHGLYNEFVKNVGGKNGYLWYETDEFKKYLDLFAKFVKDMNGKIVNYANVDVIFNPELTYKSQKYLEEEHGLHPIPVVHADTDRKYLIRYLKDGYKYIALGGVGQKGSYSGYKKWADEMFDIICDTKDRTPAVKVHGFAMTSHRLMTRYPWWSVDSTSWLRLSMYGQLIVPHLRGDQWRYDVPFHAIRVSNNPSKTKKRTTNHIMENIVERYLKEKGFVLGETNEKGEIIEKGVSNDTDMRSDANAMYFVDLCDSLPKWPWSFSLRKKLFAL